jgi:DNA-binding CsgD family transcriptional regulator
MLNTPFPNVRDFRAMLSGELSAGVNASVLPLLAERLGAAIATHRPARTASGWKSEFMLTTDDRTFGAFGDRAVKYLERAPRHYTHFDPLSVSPDQQNRVLGSATLRKILVPNDREAPLMAKEVYGPAGMLRWSHMRVVLSDGPFLLQWVGFMRAHPFARHEEGFVAAIVPELVARIRTERIVWPEVPVSFEALAQTLELIGQPAFLVTSTGTFALVNSVAHALLDRDGSVASQVMAAVSGVPSRHVHSVSPIGAAGVSRHYIVLWADEVPKREGRLRAVARHIGLTTAETRVLSQVILGDSNKDVATKLTCSVRTVEVHVASILVKAKQESRARLVAWFWTW